jgi:hypothetical protein
MFRFARDCYVERMQALDHILDQCGADDAFKADVRAFAHYQASERIRLERHAPRVKVLRTLAQLLAAEPALRVERVRIDGSSGCCDFRGTIAVTADGVEQTFEFVWDCRWKAQQEGWVDRWGSADQSRAAREFGWRCFSVWARREPAATGPAGEHPDVEWAAGRD